MKEIGRDKFELLFNKLSEHLENNGGDMKTVGIERGSINQTLSELWQVGKRWEAIILIIAYHYSRTDSLLLKLPDSVSLIGYGKSLTEIQRILGISRESECVIGRNDFEEEFSNLWGMFRREKNIGSVLENLGISDRSLLKNYWKQGYKWETVSAIIISKRLETCNSVKVETEFGTFKFTEGDYYKILETLQSALK